jgi:thiamine-monophosphate kinase
MTGESAFIAALRSLAAGPAARGLLDDAAVLDVGGTTLVLTHDMIVEGVHFLSDDPPQDVAWKLVAVNLSDLAAKGAAPTGLLVGYTLAVDSAWDEAFVQGLGEALRSFGAPLLGGDTVSAPPGAPRALGLTAIGKATGPVPSRAGARAGDLLWVSGFVGDAGAGLRSALGQIPACDILLARYRRPQPRLEAGQRLAAFVAAMMDVSDGLLIDAARMAEASGLGLDLDLDAFPLSSEYVALLGDDPSARIDAAIAGDDYELLFAAPEASAGAIADVARATSLTLTVIGRFHEGPGIRLLDRGQEVPMPSRTGWEHGSG